MRRRQATPRPRQADLVPLEAAYGMPATGGDWTYILFNKKLGAWWVNDPRAPRRIHDAVAVFKTKR